MPRERFTVFIPPQTPTTVEEVLSRAPIGALKREQYIREQEDKIDELTKGIGGKPTSFLSKLANNIPPRVEYRLDFSEKMPPEEKARIFLPAIDALRGIAQEHNVAFPLSDNLLRRIYIADEETLINATLQEAGYPLFDDVPFAVTLPNSGLCLINATEISTMPEKKREIALRFAGIHELCESLMYEEFWTKGEGNSIGEVNSRRAGIMTNRPLGIERSKVMNGYNCLKEGFFDYIAQKTLQRAGEPTPRKNAYHTELNLVQKLIERIGEGPLFQAMFTKRGFRLFHQVLTDAYGENAYQRLGKAFYQDDQNRELARLLNTRVPSFHRTRRFIESSKPVSFPKPSTV